MSSGKYISGDYLERKRGRKGEEEVKKEALSANHEGI